MDIRHITSDVARVSVVADYPERLCGRRCNLKHVCTTPAILVPKYDTQGVTAGHMTGLDRTLDSLHEKYFGRLIDVGLQHQGPTRISFWFTHSHAHQHRSE